MDNLPVEIKEVIIHFCDGETLHHLRKLNLHWKTLVDREDERKHLFKRCLKTDINKEILKDLLLKIYPKKNYLYSNPHLYKSLFYTSLRWKYFSNHQFEIKKNRHKFIDMVDLKISGNIILIGEKRGLYVMNSFNEPLKFYDLGRVKNIELYCIRSKVLKKNYEYDLADVMTENNVHHFYDIARKTFNKPKDYHERKIIKYWNEKSIELDMNEHRTDPVIKVDYFENFVMIVTNKHVIRSKDSCLSRVHKTPFSCQGARALFLWHSKLAICARDESLNIFVDGKTNTIEYLEFPPITGILYYAGWLFLGSKYGFLYGYQLRCDEILFLELENFQIKLRICDTPITNINVIEKKIPSLVVASEEEIFIIRCNAKERTD